MKKEKEENMEEKRYANNEWASPKAESGEGKQKSSKHMAEESTRDCLFPMPLIST